MRARRAFTLVESVVSLAIVALIGAAIGSSMLLAARASPASTDRDSTTLTACQWADMLAGDLALAQTITSSSATSAEFTVADRTGDSVPETIRWEWPGAAGSTLRRTYNGVMTQGPALASFKLTFNTVSGAEDIASTPAEGSETLLCDFNQPTTASSAMSSARRFGQAFLPRLSGGATAYRVSRIMVYMTGMSLAQVFNVNLYAQSAAGHPTGTSLGGGSMTIVSLLSGSGFITLPISGSAATPAGTPMMFVLRQSAGLNATMNFKTNVPDAVGMYDYSADSGSTWTSTADSSMRFLVYGYQTLPTTVTCQRTRAVGATVSLMLNSSAATAVSRGIPLPARPITAETVTTSKPTPGIVETLLKLLTGGAL